VLKFGAICGTAGVVEAVVIAEATPEGLGAPAVGVCGTIGARLRGVVLPAFPNAPTKGIVGVIVVAILVYEG
jgi:hypothetical protein